MAVLSKPFVTLIALAASFVPTLSAPAANVDARQNNFFPVTGPAVGGVQPRLEIRDVAANADYYNLYLLATIRFKAMNQDEKLSYFQIGGIHGQPLIDWDNSHSNGGNTNVGYCPHGSNLFGPWHRPYLSVYEQILSQKAVEIVNEFPNGPTKDRYRDIASRLRLPYWDWAKKTGSNEPILPLPVTQQTVTVRYPNGTSATVENPLLLYRFHPLKPSYFTAPWDDNTFTIRNSDDGNTSDPAETESTLQSFAPSVKSTLYQILTQWQTYNQFSNHGSDPSFIGNLESVHDMIHGAFGFAHMGYVPVAAFDPVFWLHHANVDRVLAIWQRLYPDTYVDPYVQGTGTWTIAPGSTADVNSPLTPFHRNAQGDYHTSATSRLTDSFQYTYPEIIGNPSNATLKARINALYAPSTTSIAKFAVSPSQPRAFVLAIEAPLFQPGTYNVDVFLGNITSQPDNWLNDPTFVGALTFMTRTQSGNDNQIVKGSVILTEALQKKFSEGSLKGLETSDIVAYLKDNLHWRVQKGKDEIPRENVPNFKVGVLSTEVKPAKSTDDFPTYVGGWKEHPEVTSGKPGGL